MLCFCRYMLHFSVIYCCTWGVGGRLSLEASLLLPHNPNPLFSFCPSSGFWMLTHIYIYIGSTDHGCLTWLSNFKHPEGQMVWWLKELQEYHFHGWDLCDSNPHIYLAEKPCMHVVSCKPTDYRVIPMHPQRSFLTVWIRTWQPCFQCQTSLIVWCSSHQRCQKR